MGWGYTIRSEIGSSVQWVAGCCVASMIVPQLTRFFMRPSKRLANPSMTAVVFVNVSRDGLHCYMLHVTCYVFIFPLHLPFSLNAIYL